MMVNGLLATAMTAEPRRTRTAYIDLAARQNASTHATLRIGLDNDGLIVCGDDQAIIFNKGCGLLPTSPKEEIKQAHCYLPDSGIQSLDKP
jgi:hypothetical protein